jgi:hypothetical protein
MKSPLSSLLKRPLSPDGLAFIASPAGIFSAPHSHSRFPEVPSIAGRCETHPSSPSGPWLFKDAQRHDHARHLPHPMSRRTDRILETRSCRSDRVGLYLHWRATSRERAGNLGVGRLVKLTSSDGQGRTMTCDLQAFASHRRLSLE